LRALDPDKKTKGKRELFIISYLQLYNKESMDTKENRTYTHAKETAFGFLLFFSFCVLTDLYFSYKKGERED